MTKPGGHFTERLTERLLGLEPTSLDAASDAGIEWSALPTGDGALFVGSGLLAIVALVVFLYRREAPAVSTRARVVMATLRVLVVAAVVAMLLEPVLVVEEHEEVPSHLIVLLDDSSSVRLTDAHPRETEARDTALALGLDGTDALRRTPRFELARRALDAVLPELDAAGDRIVHLHRFGGTVRETSWDEWTDPRAATSAVGQALAESLATYRGLPLAGIVIVSDGRSNAGPDPVEIAKLAGADGVPVHVIALGTPEGPRNARVTELSASPVVFVRDPIPITAVVEARGFTAESAQLALEVREDGGDWQSVEERSIVLGEGSTDDAFEGRVQTVTFTTSRDAPTELEFRVVLRDLGEELTTDDNIASTTVKVIRSKIRVLLVAGIAFPEIEFLRNALQRDSAIELSSWLQSADDRYEHQGDVPIARLPATDDELDRYDCFLLYDVDLSAAPPGFGDMVERFVGDAGGGVVFIAGESHTRSIFDGKAPGSDALLRLFPVVRERGLFRTEVEIRLSAENAYDLDVTEAGRQEELFQFHEDEEINREVLSGLPGMYWHFPVTRAKSGATVYARHGDPRMRNDHGPHVMVAGQLYGPGRSYFLAFDSTYRWRFVDDQFFDRFWARLVDRAGRSKLLGGRHPFTLSTDRPRYRPQSTVTMTARFRDRAAVGDLRELRGEVEAGTTVAPISLTPDGEAGVFRATFPVAQSGVHFVRVWSGEASPGARPATLRFDVELPDREFENPTRDDATLTAIADASNGRFYELGEARAVAENLITRRVAIRHQHRHELWDAPLIWGCLLLWIVLEWILRKRYRLV